MSYQAPVKDMLFDIEHLANIEEIASIPGFEDAGLETAQAVLEECARFNEGVVAPLNHEADKVPSSLAGNQVTTSKGFKEAFKQYAEGGWQGLQHPADFGGQGLPKTIGAACGEILNAANLSFALCPLLTDGAIEALLTAGSDELKATYLEKLVSGEWTGTMNLTEPQAGSDLALVRTRAEPQPDGTYRVFGTKIFITYGEHDMADNIVHLVLARVQGAPEGVKGISLFVVPKFMVGKDGALGDRNDVYCVSIEHKMGIKASATCVMNFDGAEGYLIGEANRGLNAMFTMMNTARLAVGIQGLGLIDRAYQNSLAYARDRLQMRALSGAKFPDKPADPLIVHPDIRRMLLTQKAFAEGGRCMALHAATLVDIVHRSEDADERKEADELLSFMIPIVKALLTEAAVECTYDAMQIFGGHGYIAEWGMEQLARDARITTVYEGTTGIQALDLLGRKVMQLSGVGAKHFLKQISDLCTAEATNPVMGEFIGAMAQIAKEWQAITMEVGKRGAQDPDEIGAAAFDYLWYTGYLAMAYWWARSVAAVHKSEHGDAYKAAKLETARFYFQRILPRAVAHGAAIRSGARTLLSLADEGFDS